MYFISIKNMKREFAFFSFQVRESPKRGLIGGEKFTLYPVWQEGLNSWLKFSSASSHRRGTLWRGARGFSSPHWGHRSILDSWFTSQGSPVHNAWLSAACDYIQWFFLVCLVSCWIYPPNLCIAISWSIHRLVHASILNIVEVSQRLWSIWPGLTSNWLPNMILPYQ